MSVKVDLANLEELAKKLRQANAKLQVGWFESAKYGDDTPVAGVAAVQELGSARIPQRPFFRPAIEEKKEDWIRQVSSDAKSVLSGSLEFDQLLNRLGLRVQGDVKEKISGSHPALSPVTLALRRIRDEGGVINAGMVGRVAGAVRSGKTGAGELGQPSANTTPLSDTNYMLSTLTYEVSQ